MKTPFPLFARLLVWFYLNLLILVVGLMLMVRLQFGSLHNWLLPQSAQDQIQAMCVVATGDLGNSPRGNWSAILARLSSAYKMNFALYDRHGQYLAGAELDPPREILQAMTFAADSPPAVPMQDGPGMTPPWQPPGLDPRLSAPPPTGARSGPRIVPDFPKSVVKTDGPSAYWLMVRLPAEPLQLAEGGPVTLVGMTPSLGISPLLLDPKPWIVVALGIIVFSILFWFPFARNLTRSIEKMTRATESIAEGHFDILVTDSRRDELGRLGHAINRMAGRLKDFVTGQKRFLGDAAHELSSPLARMEIALSILEARAGEKPLQGVGDVREELIHMRELVNELLSFSKASLGQSHVKLAPVNLSETVEAAIHLEKRDECRIEADVPGTLNVLANRELLCRAVANLLRNAVRYAGHAGTISVRAVTREDAVLLSVCDQGPGIPPGEIEKVFDPFYRVDKSRTSETGGVGLGLAIVKSCMEACHGTVSALNRPTGGLEVRLNLSRADATTG